MEACLQDHREQDGFSERCRQALEARMERQAADYQLNYGLRCVGCGMGTVLRGCLGAAVGASVKLHTGYGGRCVGVQAGTCCFGMMFSPK